MKFKQYRAEFIRLVKFNIIGVMNTAIDYAVFFVLTSFMSMIAEPAQVIAYSAGVINSYFMNRFWTFGVKGKHDKKQFLLFVLLNAVALIISTALIHLMKDWFSHIMIAKIPVTLVVMFINYFGQKLIVFNNSESKTLSEGLMNRVRYIIDRMDQVFLIGVMAIASLFGLSLLILENFNVLEIALPLILIVVLYIVTNKYLSSEKHFAIGLFVSALVIRFAYALVVNVPPISDFKLMLDAAQMINSGDYSYNEWQYFIDWSYQLGFVGYQALVLKIVASVKAIQLLNCLYMAITSVLVYDIGRRIFGSRTGRIAGILHLTYLPLIYYAPVLSNQHIATVFYYLFIWFLLKETELSKRNAVFAGISLALGQVFRPLGVVFILALLLYVFYRIGRMKWKSAQSLIILGVIYVITFQVVLLVIGGTGISENGLANNDPYWKFVPGLNQQYFGRYNPIDNDMYLSNPNAEARQVIEKEIIKERLLISPIEMAKFQVVKIGSFWGDYENSIFGLHHLSEKQYNIYYTWYSFDQVFDVFKHMEKVLYILAFVGGILTVSKIRVYDERSRYLAYVLSFYMGVHLFIEVSVRYRYVMMGIILILGAKGISEMLHIIKSKRRAYGS